MDTLTAPPRPLPPPADEHSHQDLASVSGTRHDVPRVSLIKIPKVHPPFAGGETILIRGNWSPDVSLTYTLPPGRWRDERCLSSGAFLPVQVTIAISYDVGRQILYHLKNHLPSSFSLVLHPSTLLHSFVYFLHETQGMSHHADLKDLNSQFILYLPPRSKTDRWPSPSYWNRLVHCRVPRHLLQMLCKIYKEIMGAR